MKLDELAGDVRSHPVHPPLTDVVVGLYAGATGAAVLSALGVAEKNLAAAWWLALVGGLVMTVPTALAGLWDWFKITPGMPVRRTARAHMLVMVTAAAIFLVTAIVGHGSYVDRSVGASDLVLTIAGFAVLGVGGFLGGTIVYVYGTRVRNEAERPGRREPATQRPVVQSPSEVGPVDAR
jgi:uncharacterized membrane protein